jgi:hypothetical protein
MSLTCLAQTILWRSALYRRYFRWCHDLRRRRGHYSASERTPTASPHYRQGWRDTRPQPWSPELRRRRVQLRQGYLSRKYTT